MNTISDVTLCMYRAGKEDVPVISISIRQIPVSLPTLNDIVYSPGNALRILMVRHISLQTGTSPVTVAFLGFLMQMFKLCIAA